MCGFGIDVLQEPRKDKQHEAVASRTTIQKTCFLSGGVPKENEMLKQSEREVRTLKIADLKISNEFQMRASACETTIDEYRQAIDQTEGEWPFSTACSVFKVGDELILVDGHHRVSAMLKAGRDTIQAVVTDGSKSDALIAALGANHSHGLRRTNADKRRAITVALSDDLLKTMSDRQLAELCGVSQPFVGQVRGELITVISSPTAKRSGADGKARPANKACMDNQREKIAAALTGNEGESDSRIAKQVGCDRKTVASVRAEIENPKEPSHEVISQEIPQDFFWAVSGYGDNYDDDDDYYSTQQFNVSLDRQYTRLLTDAIILKMSSENVYQILFGVDSEEEYEKYGQSEDHKYDLVAPTLGRYISTMCHAEKMKIVENWICLLKKNEAWSNWEHIYHHFDQIVKRTKYHGQTWYPIWVKLDVVQTLPGIQIDQEKVEAFRARLQYCDDKWPFRTPVEIYWCDDKLLLTDGHHRAEAARLWNPDEPRVLANIICGTISDAYAATQQSLMWWYT